MRFDIEAARRAGYSNQEIRAFMARNNLTAVKTVEGFGKNIVKSSGKLVGDTASSLVNILNPDLEKNTLANVVRLGGSLVSLVLPGEQGNEDLARQVGQYYANRYGGLDKAWESFYSDPAGVAADVSAVLGGAGLAAKGVGLAGVGQKLTSVSRAVHPFGIASKAVSTIASPAKSLFRKAGTQLVDMADDLPTKGMGNPSKLKTAKGVSPLPMDELFKKYGISNRSAEEFYRAASEAGDMGNKLMKVGGKSIPTKEVVSAINKQIAELKPLADAGSTNAVKTIQELQRRLQELVVVSNNGAPYSPLNLQSEALINAKRAAYADLPKGVFAKAAADPGLTEGMQKFYRTMIQSGDKIAPGTRQLGREQSALLTLADIAESAGARSSARMLANPIDVATTVGSYAYGGIPGVVAKYGIGQAINDPRVLSVGSRALRGLGTSMQNAQLPPIPQWANTLHDVGQATRFLSQPNSSRSSGQTLPIGGGQLTGTNRLPLSPVSLPATYTNSLSQPSAAELEARLKAYKKSKLDIGTNPFKKIVR